jgi:DNA end-binding protein Ku
LCGVTLRFAHEVRSKTDYFGDIPEMKLRADMMKLAQHIIKTKSADFDASMLEDHYRTALVRILRKKQANRSAHPAPVKPAPENVLYLMDALQRSIAAEKRPASKSTTRWSAARSPAKRTERARKARWERRKKTTAQCARLTSRM